MLFRGMKGTKIGFVVFLLVIILFALLLSIIFAKRHYKQYLTCDEYYKKMLISLKEPSYLSVQDIFNFEFDWAYVANETYGDEKYFLKKLDVNTNINIPLLETGAHNRILFIKDNFIIYDFIYEIGEINILETGTTIFPDTTIILTQQSVCENRESVIQVDFKGQ